MANVPEYNTVDVSPTVTAPDDYQSVDAGPEKFGGLIGQALGGLGESIGQAGANIKQAVDQAQQLNNENAATDASTQFSAKAADLSAKFYSLSGAAAAQAFPAYQQSVQDLHDSIIASMPDPVAKSLAGQDLSRRLGYMQEGAATFAAQQSKVWSVQASDARADQNINDAAQFRNDPTKVMAFLAAGTGEIAKQGGITGAAPEVVQQQQEQYIGKGIKTVVANMITDGNALGAQALFQSARGSMDAVSAVDISQMLRPAVVDAVSSNALNAVTYRGQADISSTVDFPTLSGAVEGQESGGQQFTSSGQPLVSAKGAVGRMQVEPATAQGVAPTIGLTYDPQQLARNPTYNKKIGDAYLQQQLNTFQNPTLAVAAYNAGPGAVQDAIKTYGDPRTGAISMADFLKQLPHETQLYVQGIAAKVNLGAGIGTTDAPSSAPVDEQSLLAKLQALPAYQQMDPEEQFAAMAKVHQYATVQAGVTAQARAVLDGQIDDTNKALLAGQSVPIPTQQVLAAYPADQATQIINGMQTNQYAGQLLKSVAFSTPQDRQNMLLDISTGTGPISTALRTREGVQMNADGSVAPGDQARDDVARSAVTKALMDQMKTVDTALKADPAGYMLQDQTVAADYQKYTQSNNPQDFAAYATASQALQTRMGVPADQQYILPASAAASIAKKLANTDPATEDMGAVIDQTANQYGAQWPIVYKQLVTQQGISPQWQTVAAMDAPGQGPARADMVRAIQADAKGGGLAGALGKDPAGKDVTTDIATAMGDNTLLQNFQSTVAIPGYSANADVISTVNASVKTLASYYTLQGKNPSAAVTLAAQNILGKKYDFDGTYRVPAGMLPQANTMIQRVENGLGQNVSASYPGAAPGASLTDQQQLKDLITAPKIWLTNGADDGLIMAYRRQDGSVVPVYGKDNQPIGFKFSALADMSQAPLLPSTAR